jgi:hypothetical protein
MDQQPEALRLADELETAWKDMEGCAEFAAELRRLHQSEREGWRYANELEQERKRLHSVNAQLLEALEEIVRDYSYHFRQGNPWGDKARAAIAAAKEVR